MIRNVMILVTVKFVEMVQQESETTVLTKGIKSVLNAVNDFYLECRKGYGSIALRGRGMPLQLVKELRLELKQKPEIWIKWQPEKIRVCVDDLHGILEQVPASEKEGITAAGAYEQSLDTYQAIYWWIHKAVFNPKMYRNGQPIFESLERHLVQGDMMMDSWLVYASPGSPNLTIISIQPQLAPATEILHTEFWTLCYWAKRFMRRIRTHPSLPVRLVSICGIHARILSTNFSHGYLKCLYQRDGAPQDSPKCSLHIGAYHELREESSFLALMTDLVSIPKAPAFSSDIGKA
ncbi:hypothetical protein ACLMJK_007467 [Lecanora helva]